MFEQVIQGIFSTAFLASILRVATPILLPSLGALISSRAGVLNIGLEGIMLSSAFTGVVVSAYAQQWFGAEFGMAIGPWLGLISGVGIGVLIALVLGFFHLRLKGDLVLSGVAINVLGSAATVAIMFELTGDRGNTSTLASLQIPFIQLPRFINDIPLIGSFIYGVFNNQSAMTWIAFISVALVSFMLYRTPFGMHLRASGENPSAAESVGIRVTRVQYSALALSGLFAGLGGIHMSMGYLTLFQRDMTSGRGFIALATPLLGGNTPLGTGIASVVFGFFDALAIRIGSLQIPSMLPQMIPFVATIMALVVYALQHRQVLRVRALRAIEGENFKAAYWSVVQRLSVLHVVIAMLGVIGIVFAVSMFSAPNGFGGADTALPNAFIIAVVSITLSAINLPFISRVERVTTSPLFSLGAIAISICVYLGVFLVLFMDTLPALGIALVVGIFVWFIAGGWRLLRATERPLAVA